MTTPYTPSILRYGNTADRPRQAGRALLLFILALTFEVGGGQAQVSTLTVGSASDAAYTATITPLGGEAVPIYYNQGSAGTEAQKATGLANQINANAALARVVTASASAAVVTITSLIPGARGAFTLSTSDGKLTAATTTSAANCDEIPFGCAVAHFTGGKIAQTKTSRGVAKVMTVTPANVTNNEIYTIVVTGDLNGDGIPETYTAPYQDGSATAKRLCDAMTAAFNTLFPASSILVSDDDSVITFTSEVPGLDFVITASVTDDAGAAATGTLAVATSTANTPIAFAGVAQAMDVPQQQVTSGVGVAKWGGADAVPAPVIRSGVVAVRLDADITSNFDPSSPVAYRIDASGTGEEYGTFRNAKSGADTLTLPQSRARWVDGIVTTDLAGYPVTLLELS